MAQLTCIDVLHVMMIEHLIMSTRNKRYPTFQMELLICISDSIKSTNMPRYVNYKQYFSRISVSENVLTSLTAEIREKVISLDTFLDFISSVSGLFEYGKTESVNELIGPIKICQDSQLGVCMRSFIARWEYLSFEESCVMYEKMVMFMTETTASTFVEGHRKQSKTSRCNLQLARDAVNDSDLSAAADAIHRHFDLCGSLPLSAAGQPSDNSTMAVDLAMQGLLQYVEGNGDSELMGSSKVTELQQRAMLSVVTMYVAGLTGYDSSCSGGNSDIALAGVEEAMRIAHKRGDHSAVARTLLLMYFVLQEKQSEMSGAFDIGLEDLLLRCIQRFITLKHYAMMTEATLNLVALRAKTQPLRWSNTFGEDTTDVIHEDNDDDDVDLMSTKWSVADMWTQISVALLGDPVLTSKVVSASCRSSADLKMNIPVMTAIPQAPHLKQSNTKGASSLSSTYLTAANKSDQVRLNMSAGLVVCDLWRRLGVLEMADLTCRGTIRQYGARADPSDSIKLHCRLVLIRTDSVNISMLDKKGYATSDKSLFLLTSCDGIEESCSRPYDEILSYIKDIQTQYFNQDRNVRLAELLDGSLAYLRVHQCVYENQLDRALRLAEKAVDTATLGYECENVAECSLGMSSLSEEYLRARILLAKVLSITNHDAARQMLLDVEKCAANRRLIVIENIASVVRHALALHHCKQPALKIDATLQLKSVIALARKISVAETEIAIASSLFRE